MYAIVKTGGKQYKVAPGDKINIEKIDAEVGDKIELPVLCIVDGKKVEAHPEKAAATKVQAEVIDQFRDKKVIVFKFKKRKNYKKKHGHRQSMTRVLITAVGSEKMQAVKDAKKTTKKADKPAKAEKADKDEKPAKAEKSAEKPAAKTTKKAPAKKTEAASTKATKKAADEDKKTDE